MASFNFTIIVTDFHELIVEADNYEKAERIVDARIDVAEYGDHLDREVTYNLLTGPEVTQVA